VDASGSVFDDCTFEGNSGTGGGAAFSVRSNSWLQHCRFEYNQANNGGAMYNVSSDTIAFNCRFISNKATSRGGAIAEFASSYEFDPLDIGEPKYVNSVFFGNEADKGGALYTYWTLATCMNCTIVRNEARLGGGLLTAASGDTVVTVYNSIVKGNLGGSFSGKGKRKVRYSNIGGGHNGTSQAAIANLPTGVTVDTAVDVDGNPRFVDVPGVPNTGAGSPPIDMGAYEFQP
jgi:hypothetical protein